MPADSMALVYIKSQSILDFLEKHPVNWANRDLAKRGGMGDSAGMPPTPAVREFLSLLRQTHDLFTQDAFASHCQHAWSDWWDTLNDRQQLGVTAKLYRNFYPSLIDSLHVWSLLVEAQWFDRCIMDSCDDATGDTDLTLTRDDKTIRVALIGPTAAAQEDRHFKRTYRHNGVPVSCYTVQLPAQRPMAPGNKRWFCLDDFCEFRPRDLPSLPAAIIHQGTVVDTEATVHTQLVEFLQRQEARDVRLEQLVSTLVEKTSAYQRANFTYQQRESTFIKMLQQRK